MSGADDRKGDAGFKRCCMVCYILMLYPIVYYYATHLWSYYKYNWALDQTYPTECLIESIYQEEFTVVNECGNDTNYVTSINVTYQDESGENHTDVPSCNFGSVCLKVENEDCEKQTCNKTGYDPTYCGPYISYDEYYYYYDEGDTYRCYVSVSNPNFSSLIRMKEEDYFWSLAYPTTFVVIFLGAASLFFSVSMSESE